MGVKVTVGGKVSVIVGVGEGVSDGNGVTVRVAVGVSEGGVVGVCVPVAVGDGEAVAVAVAVTKNGVKDGTRAVPAAAVWVAGTTHNGVLVGCSGRDCSAPKRTRANPVQ